MTHWAFKSLNLQSSFNPNSSSFKTYPQLSSQQSSDDTTSLISYISHERKPNLKLNKSSSSLILPVLYQTYDFGQLKPAIVRLFATAFFLTWNCINKLMSPTILIPYHFSRLSSTHIRLELRISML